MSHLQFLPGDHQLVDQLVYELKSKGIFDQFRKDCFADVDTKPAYQNLRQRVETSVQMFLSRQTWRPDLNKNQLREKLRKHILDGNYLEQGVNRIVDQVVNPKIASVFIPQVEELFYNHLGIQRPKPIAPAAEETSNGKIDANLLPTDLEAVSPGSVKSQADNEDVDVTEDNNEEMQMDIDEGSQSKESLMEESQEPMLTEKSESQLSGISDLTSHSSDSVDNSTIPLPSEIKPENIPLPEVSQPKIELDKIDLPQDSEIPLPEIPLPDIPMPETEKETFFKPINLGSEEDSSSSDSSLIRNMSPLTPVRNFDDENSCDAQQGFENEVKADDTEPQPASFRFTIEANKSAESSRDGVKTIEKKEPEANLSYQFESQVNLNTYNTPLYEDSSNSNNLQIDYESDVNSKTNTDAKLPEPDQSSQDVKKEKQDDKKSHKSSHSSRDSHRHSSSSKDRRSDSKHSSSRDKESKHEKKSSSKDESSKKSKRERSRDRSDKKDSRDSSKHRPHKSSSSGKDSKHKSSTSSQRHSSSRHDDKKSSSSSSHRDKSSSKDYKSRDSKSSSHKSDKDRKSSSSRKDEKDKDKKEKKETDDHYSLSGRGNINRRSTDRDSNDGNSTSSKGSNVQSRNTDANNKKEKSASSKSETTSSSSGTSPSEKEVVLNNKISQARSLLQAKSAVRVENHLESPRQSSSARFLPEVVLKKPKFASNYEEAKKMMKLRKFMDEEQRRMNQEAALLLEFQANVRPNMSQVYSNVSGPELEFACENNEQINSSKESNNESLIMEEVCLEDFAIMEDNHSDTDTIESLAEIQKEVDDIALSTSEIKDEAIKEDVTKTSDELLKDLSETEDSESDTLLMEVKQNILEMKIEEDLKNLKFFNQTEKYDAESYRDSYSRFLKTRTDKNTYDNKLHLINCSKYEEDLFREISNGDYEIIRYHRNGHSGLQKSAKYIDFNNREVTIPIPDERSLLRSPVKSESSFDLSSDYDAKLEDMMHTTSRQQIMEIILGGALDDSPTKMPTIDICKESSIEISATCKRRFSEIECNDNNNRQVLTQNKIRKISGSDQISSTTEENGEATSRCVSGANAHSALAPRSRFLGKAKRVGLPRPRKPNVTSSPTSDKSVENYEENNLGTPPAPNGRVVKQPRNKVQRYDTSDLYKPKLHFLSRRNNVT